MLEKIKILKIIHLAICAGTILAYFFVGNISIENFKIPNIDAASAVFLLIPILCIAMSQIIFKTLLNQIVNTQNIDEKLAVYQSASIIRWAILEGGAFLILFLKPDFIIFGVLIIIYLAFLAPSEDKIKNDLNFLN